MRVCVTGGSGFIGTYFCEMLVRAGHEPVILDLVAPMYPVEGVRVVLGDIRDPVAVREALQGCEACINLAAAHHDFGIPESVYFDVNENGSRVLCEAMTELGIDDACFYSSVAIYGTAPEPITETSRPEPENPYGASKLAAEDNVYRPWVEAKPGRRCLVMRPSVVIGPRNWANMFSLIRQIDSGKFVRVGDGRNVKSLAFVENLVEATGWLWGMNESSSEPRFEGYEAFNYVEKPDLTSDEIIEVIYGALGKKTPGFRVPLRLALLMGLPFDVAIAVTGKNLPVSTARIKKLATQTKFEADRIREWGYVPKVGVREGIERMVRWYDAEARGKAPPPAPEFGAISVPAHA